MKGKQNKGNCVRHSSEEHIHKSTSEHLKGKGGCDRSSESVPDSDATKQRQDNNREAVFELLKILIHNCMIGKEDIALMV